MEFTREVALVVRDLSPSSLIPSIGEKSRDKTSETSGLKNLKLLRYGFTSASPRSSFSKRTSPPVMKFAKSSARVSRARKSHHAVDLSQFPFAHKFNLFARPTPL